MLRIRLLDWAYYWITLVESVIGIVSLGLWSPSWGIKLLIYSIPIRLEMLASKARKEHQVESILARSTTTSADYPKEDKE